MLRRRRFGRVISLAFDIVDSNSIYQIFTSFALTCLFMHQYFCLQVVVIKYMAVILAAILVGLYKMITLAFI